MSFRMPSSVRQRLMNETMNVIWTPNTEMKIYLKKRKIKIVWVMPSIIGKQKIHLPIIYFIIFIPLEYKKRLFLENINAWRKTKSAHCTFAWDLFNVWSSVQLLQALTPTLNTEHSWFEMQFKRKKEEENVFACNVQCALYTVISSRLHVRLRLFK